MKLLQEFKSNEYEILSVNAKKKLLLIKSSQIVFNFLLIFSLVLIYLKPVAEYELSLYESTPLIFWISIIFCLINAFFLIYFYIIHNYTFSLYLGILQIMLCDFIILSLSAFRGYTLTLGHGDTASYIGMAKDVVLFNCILDYNSYPITSILISSISQISNLSILPISQYFPAYLFLIFMISIYIWAKGVVNIKKFSILCLVAVSPIFFAWFSTTITHEYLSILILPLVFYCFTKISDKRYFILAIIFLLIYPFFHPITAMTLLVYLAVFVAFYINKSNQRYTLKFLNLLIVLAISFLFWMAFQYGLLHSFGVIVKQVTDQLDVPTSADQANYYLETLGFYETLKTALIMTIDEIIFYILSFTAIIILFTKHKSSEYKNLFPLIYCFIVGNIVMVFYFFSARVHSSTRLMNLNINMIFTPIFVGLLLFFFVNKERSKAIALIITLICICSLFTILSLYQSPISMRPNDAITVNEISGAKWLIDNKDTNIKIISFKTSLTRFADLIYGYNFRLSRSDLVHEQFNPTILIQNTSQSSIDLNYLLLTDYDIQGFTKIWKTLNRYTYEDFRLIENSENISKLYCNNDMSIYFI